MDGSRTAGWVAEEKRRSRRFHIHGVPAQQRAHFAALLIAALFALPLFAQSDISLDPAITQQEFQKFSRLVAQGIFASPVQPAGAAGVLRFDIGLAATLVHVDTHAAYWQHATGSDFSTGGYVGIPRLVVVKGLGFATVAGSYSKISDTGISVLGGSVDLPIIRGGLLEPTVALRGSYSTLQGADDYKLKTYGLEGFIGKGFTLLTVYGGYGRMRGNAEGTIPNTTRTLKDNSSINRYTVGVRFSLGLPKVVVEATQAEERAYSAKISVGL